MSHRLFLKNLEALSASGWWEAAVITKNAKDDVAQKEANWLHYFAYRTGRLAQEFKEMLDEETNPSAPPVPKGGGFSIPPPKGGGGGGNSSGGNAPSYA